MISDDLNRYIHKNSRKESSFLAQISDATEKTQEEPHMLCGPLVGTFLSFLVRLTNAKRVLDIGTFMGFSALSIAEALDEKASVITCELNPTYAQIAKKNIQNHPDGHKVKLFYGDAADCIEQINEPIDLSFLDADKKSSLKYYKLLVEKTRPGGIIVIDDALWKGKVHELSEIKHINMNELNEFVIQDPRVENLLIPLRHGINLVYKLKQ